MRALPTKPQQEQSSIGGKGGIKAAIPHALFIINNFDSVPARTSVEGNRLKQIGMESEPLSQWLFSPPGRTRFAPQRQRSRHYCARSRRPQRAEVPSTATSVAGKASARPELENSQAPKRTRTVKDFLQRKFIIEAHFAGRKSLM
jgi:hypothetical protein